MQDCYFLKATPRVPLFTPLSDKHEVLSKYQYIMTKSFIESESLSFSMSHEQ